MGSNYKALRQKYPTLGTKYPYFAKGYTVVLLML